MIIVINSCLLNSVTHIQTLSSLVSSDASELWLPSQNYSRRTSNVPSPQSSARPSQTLSVPRTGCEFKYVCLKCNGAHRSANCFRLTFVFTFKRLNDHLKPAICDLQNCKLQKELGAGRLLFHHHLKIFVSCHWAWCLRKNKASFT